MNHASKTRKGTRRTFTEVYKKRILQEVEETKRKGGKITPILKREGITFASLTQWRQTSKAVQKKANIWKEAFDSEEDQALPESTRVQALVSVVETLLAEIKRG